MPSDDKLLMILEKLGEISERTARIEVGYEHMKADVAEIKRQDDIQNKLLDEHIKGVATAQQRLTNEIEVRKALETRVSKLEEPSKFLSLLKKYIVWIGAVAGAIAGIIKAALYFHK